MRGNDMNKKAILWICLLIFAILCAFIIFRYDGPYKGRVLDAGTGQPLEGVVVLGVWYEGHPGPGGGSHKYYDAQETVTDKDGNFDIKGLGLKTRFLIEPMDVIIFKSGYESVDMYPWKSFYLEGAFPRDKIKFGSGRVIFLLKKLTMDERRKQGTPSSTAEVPDEKTQVFKREVNQERMSLGYKPL
jgi:hypothetical protein